VLGGVHGAVLGQDEPDVVAGDLERRRKRPGHVGQASRLAERDGLAGDEQDLHTSRRCFAASSGGIGLM
jgi:hypothetical protein